MPSLTSAQIITLACQIARATGFTSQAGQLLNVILDELCQNYDFELARTTFNFSFNSSTGQNSGPYALPADFLRCEKDEITYLINYQPYKMVRIDVDEYDVLSQQPGLASYPEYFTTVRESSQTPAAPTATIPPASASQMFFWPPPSGSYPISLRYFRQMPSISTPETSSTVPWFENQGYLITRLAGELMKLTNDDRAQLFLGDGDGNFIGAGKLLRSYLKLKDDPEGRAKLVTLDRRRFGTSFNRLPNTKVIGW